MKKTNYCTFAPDKIGKYYIGYACRDHDSYYQDDDKYCSRKEADTEFLKDLLDIFPWYLEWVAFLYYFAVRLTCKPAWKRWEYKWYLGFIPIRRRNVPN